MIQLKSLLPLLFLVWLNSCDNSKWETIRGKGIDEQAKSIESVIYFENENNGLVGGYTLITNNSIENGVKLSEIPTLYITKDGGQNWTEVKLGPLINQSVINATIHHDSLFCQTDSLIFFSANNGLQLQVITDSTERKNIIARLARPNRYDIKDHNFKFDGKEYYITERFKNNYASVIVCSDSKTLTGYYFVSFDDGKKWSFLQKEPGDNRDRFLLEDKFLFCYHFPFGLKKLRLKQKD